MAANKTHLACFYETHYSYHETHYSLLLYVCGTLGLFFYIIKRTVHAYILGNIKLISRVEQDIPLFRFAHKWDIVVKIQNQFHISKHPSILYLYETAYVPAYVTAYVPTDLYSLACTWRKMPQFLSTMYYSLFCNFLTAHYLFFIFSFIQCLKHEQQYFIAFKIRSDSRVF